MCASFLVSAPNISLSHIPTTWLLAPSYHFPSPFSWEAWSLILRRPVACLPVTDLSCAWGAGEGGGSHHSSRGQGGPGVNHHHGRSSPFLFVFPRGKRDEAVSLISRKLGCLL